MGNYKQQWGERKENLMNFNAGVTDYSHYFQASSFFFLPFALRARIAWLQIPLSILNLCFSSCNNSQVQPHTQKAFHIVNGIYPGGQKATSIGYFKECAHTHKIYRSLPFSNPFCLPWDALSSPLSSFPIPHPHLCIFDVHGYLQCMGSGRSGHHGVFAL